MLKALREARKTSTQKSLLNQLLKSCDHLLGKGGEAMSLSLADQALSYFEQLDAERRITFYDLLASRYNPNSKTIIAAAKKYELSETAENLVGLTEAVESPRQELFRRLNQAPKGTSHLVQMRREILSDKKKRKELSAVNNDLQHLFASWFNPGFLHLQEINWNSPASLLEKIIKHEAVHAIESWGDLRRRMEHDRRLFAYFHPALPNEPLIFVEVAFVPEIPRAIAPLLEPSTASATQASPGKVAVFYSISNCQPGLKGVSLGNFLIKRVAEALQREIPHLHTFCTLSPVPSFATFLQSKAPLKSQLFAPEKIRTLEALRSSAREHLTTVGNNPMPPSLLKDLSRLCAAHLTLSAVKDYPLADPVARFHLGNGAQLKQINPDGDLSPKGLKESYGFMVNYAYVLTEIEANYEKFTTGKVALAKRVRALLP